MKKTNISNHSKYIHLGQYSSFFLRRVLILEKDFSKKKQIINHVRTSKLWKQNTEKLK